MPAQHITGNNKEARNQTFQGSDAVLHKPMHPVAGIAGLPVSSSLPNAIHMNTIDTDGEEQIDMKSESEGRIQLMGNPNGDDEQNQDAIQLSGGNGDSYASSGVESGVNRTKGGGNPLPSGMATEMGQKIGADFSNVRTHTDQNAIQMNQELVANAFSHGNDIYFNKNQYNPSSPDGKRLLAHELTHTVQQNANTVSRDTNTPQIQKQDDGETVNSEALTRGNPEHILTSSERSELRFTQRLTQNMDEWSSTMLETTLRRLGGDINAEMRSRYHTRIRNLVNFRRSLRNSLSPHLSQVDDILTLANIIYNEAGVHGEAAHRAIGYAWLNRTGGTASANRGAELSDYRRLSLRWEGFDDVAKLTFIQHFPHSVQTATSLINMSDAARSSSDPTQGATHWLSPESLPDFDPARHATSRYSRTVDSATNKAFPNWAVANDDTTRIEALRSEGKITSNYREIVIRGIPRIEFMFYRGVNFSR